MSLEHDKKNAVDDIIIKKISEALNGIKYGYLQITVHNSKIVQIEKTEKTRFDDIWLLEKGGGI